MRNLLLADEKNVLNRGLASKYVMQITAAEQIMTDLGVEYEPFTIPKAIRHLLSTREHAEA
jgi:hypothetical protein